MTTTCSECGATKPDGLSEEERAAWEAYRLAMGAAGWVPPDARCEGATDHKRFRAAFWHHARASLEAENAKLRERVRELEASYSAASQESIMFRGDANKAARESEMLRRMHLQICEVAQERAEKIKGLKAQLAQAQKPAPAGLPGIGTMIFVRTRSYGDVKAQVTGSDDFLAEFDEGPLKGTCTRLSCRAEGERWSRIPPAQMSTFNASVPTAQHCVGVAPAQTSREPVTFPGDVAWAIRQLRGMDWTTKIPMYGGERKLICEEIDRLRANVTSEMPARVVLTRQSAAEVSEMIENPPEPPHALVDLMKSEPSTCGMICLRCGLVALRVNESAGTCAKCGSEDAVTAKQAASPHGGVTTVHLENLRQRWGTPFGGRKGELLPYWEQELLSAVETDIRANVERERERWEDRVDDYNRRIEADQEHAEFLQNELRQALERGDVAIEEIKKDKARVAELERWLDIAERNLSAEMGAKHTVQKERDAALAEVERLKSALEQERHTSTRWSREKEDERSRAEIAEIERDDARTEVERLKGELVLANEARRCPADGMSDYSLGSRLATIVYIDGGGYDNMGAKARELFAPVKTAPAQRTEDDFQAQLNRINEEVKAATAKLYPAPAQPEKRRPRVGDKVFRFEVARDEAREWSVWDVRANTFEAESPTGASRAFRLDDEGKTWWWDNPAKDAK